MTVLTSVDAFQLIQAQGLNIVIPDTFTSIADNAFTFAGIQSVVIPDSVTSIGNNAFQLNQLTSVVIPISVTSIGIAALYWRWNHGYRNIYRW